MKRKVFIIVLILLFIFTQQIVASDFFREIKAKVVEYELEITNRNIHKTDIIEFKNKLYISTDELKKLINVDIDSDNKNISIKKFNDFEHLKQDEVFVYGEINNIYYKNKTIQIIQHYDDNSIDVPILLKASNDIEIIYQRNDKKMNLDFIDLKKGDNFGLILNKEGYIRGMIVTK